MRILVTGSTGFLGSRLVPHLQKQGHEIVSAGRTFAFRKEDLFDAVIHLAGAGLADQRWTFARMQEIMESRNHGTRELCRQLIELEHKPKTLLCMSAVGYYGNRKDEILTEASLRGEGFLSVVVFEWEASTTIASRSGIRVVNLRTGVVLDAGGGALKKMLLPFKLGLGGRIGDGTQYMSWITLGDFLSAVDFLLANSSLSGAVNVCSPQPVTNLEFTNALCKILRRPAFLPTPLPVLNLWYGRELIEATLLSGQRVLPQKLLGAGFTFQHPEIESALRAALKK